MLAVARWPRFRNDPCARHHRLDRRVVRATPFEVEGVRLRRGKIRAMLTVREDVRLLCAENTDDVDDASTIVSSSETPPAPR
jgi:hypothetical protein